MTSIADGSVNIQTTSESHVSIPSCFGEVVVISRYLQKHKVLNKINGQVRFARKRFGRYEFIDFLAVLFGYAISGERTLEEFYQRLQLFAAPFMALFERDRLPSRSALSVILTWVFNHTRGSLLLTMLGHASFNTAASLALPLFASLSIPAAFPGFDLVFGAVTLLLILATRGRLGYRRIRHGTTLAASDRGAEQTSVGAAKREER